MDQTLDSVLIISQFYAPEPIGIPLYVTDFARWLAERGAVVTVLTGRPYYPDFRLGPGYEGGKRDRETLDGVHVRRLPTYVPKGGRALGRLVNEAVCLVGALASVLGSRSLRNRYVVSVVPTVFATYVAMLARRRGGRHVAVVYDIQSGLAGGLGMLGSGVLLKMIKKLETFALNRADAVIVLSDQMRKTLAQQGVRKRMAILPLWLDLDMIRPMPPSNADRPVVLYSGNLGQKQGLGQILDLAEVLRCERPEVRVVVRGQGSQAEPLKANASTRGLANVEFLPLVPLSEVNSALAEGDVHLVPQDPSGADFAVPSKIYGILAAGRPFVATAPAGSTLWRMHEETGAFLCTPFEDPRALADAVIGLLDDPGRRAAMGAKGRAFAEATAGRDVVLGSYADLLQGRSLEPGDVGRA